MTSLRGNKGVKLNTMPPADRLTATEERIWKMRQDGKAYAEIAQYLNMKVTSVRRRMTTIREKVACHE